MSVRSWFGTVLVLWDGGLRQNLSGSDLRPFEQPAAFGSRGSWS